MSADVAVFHRLHGRALGPDGCPRLRESFVAALDASPQPSTPPAPLMSLPDALRKLAEVEPALAAIVEARYVEGQTVRAVVAALGLSTGTVHNRGWRGVRLLAAWTGIDADVVPLHLRRIGHTRLARLGPP